MIVFDLHSNTIYKSRKIFRHSNKEVWIIEPTALLCVRFGRKEVRDFEGKNKGLSHYLTNGTEQAVFDFPYSGVADGGIMANEEHSTATVFFAQEIVEKILPFEVKMGIGLVEEKEIGLRNDGAPQQNALPLPATKAFDGSLLELTDL